jgi:hypothetical protein
MTFTGFKEILFIGVVFALLTLASQVLFMPTVYASPTVIFDGNTPGGSVPADCQPDHAGNLIGNCVYIIPVGDATNWDGVRIDGSDIRMIIRGPHTHVYTWTWEECIPVRGEYVCIIRTEERTAQIPVEVWFGSMERNLQSLSVQADATVTGQTLNIQAQSFTVQANARVTGQILNIRAHDLNILSGAAINVSGAGFAGGLGGHGGVSGHRDGRCGNSINSLGNDGVAPWDCKRITGYLRHRDGPYEIGGGEAGGSHLFSGVAGSGQGGGHGGQGGSGLGSYAGGTGGSNAQGRTYGNAWLLPAHMGSGGGGGAGSVIDAGGAGGAGGGVVNLNVANFLLQSGASINSNGSQGVSGWGGGFFCLCRSSGGGGGGSGGSITINFSNAFSLAGQILTQGGRGSDAVWHSCWPCGVHTVPGGGGGGGRVAIFGPGVAPGIFGGNYTGLGGLISVTGGGAHGAAPGGSGTICVGQRPQDCGAPEFDFSLSNSGNITVPRGQTSTNVITATLTVPGNPQVVDLSISTLPTGLTHQFNPQSGTPDPTFHSTLAITASQTAATGTIPVIVTGTHGAITRQTSFSINVTDPPPPPPPPAVSFTAVPNPIVRGQSTTLSWTTSGAISCIGNCRGGDCREWDDRPPLGTTKDLNGRQTVTPRITSTYNLTCWNQEGFSTSRDVTVVVQQIRWREVIPRPLMQFIDEVLARVNEANRR